MSLNQYESYTHGTPPTRNLYQQAPRREITKMVAENPLSNGDDRGPDLPPKPPNIDGPTTTPDETLTTNGEINYNETIQKNIREIKDLLSSTNL